MNIHIIIPLWIKTWEKQLWLDQSWKISTREEAKRNWDNYKKTDIFVK